MSIWKFRLKSDREQWIGMPEGARLLSAATQFNIPTIFAQVDTEAQKRQRRIVTCVTGGGLPNGNLPFIGTCIMDGGGFRIARIRRELAMNLDLLIHQFTAADGSHWSTEDLALDRNGYLRFLKTPNGKSFVLQLRLGYYRELCHLGLRSLRTRRAAA